MNPFILLLVAILALAVGSILGYFARQSIARKQFGTIEERLHKRVSQAQNEANSILSQAKEKASQVLAQTAREEDLRRKELLETERLLLKREHNLDEKLSQFEVKERDFEEKVEKLKKIKESIEDSRQEALKKLEKVAKISAQEAKKELFALAEKEYQKDIQERMKKLEAEGWQKFEKKARELTTLAIQKVAVSQTQEVTTTTVPLPSEDIKGRIIGKEGRNIRTLERLTGVELIVDENPEAVLISSFDPIRRQVAKLALEKLIADGRIQPARIEEQVEKAQSEINSQIKEAGEQAVYDIGLLNLDPKLVQLLGRLRFRTSYSQNVLQHSLEVAYLAESLAQEVGADAKVAKKAGLLHDIGKSIDRQIEGSHVDIGIKILEKFGVEKEVISAMKSHHEEYPYESLEAIIVQASDAISASRPGARRDTLENYLKRLSDLENIAASFSGVEKAYAISAGREIRVFVKPEEIDDWAAKKMARDIAGRIQEELRYPGEIKITLIRESRIVEYAR
jgi:ribonuclease Y